MGNRESFSESIEWSVHAADPPPPSTARVMKHGAIRPLTYVPSWCCV